MTFRDLRYTLRVFATLRNQDFRFASACANDRARRIAVSVERTAYRRTIENILDIKRFGASVVAAVKAGSIDYLLLTIDYFS